jgi:hypothetical protein
MTRIKQISILILTALIFTLGNAGQSSVLAATRPAASPQTASRFVVFEAFLSAG